MEAFCSDYSIGPLEKKRLREGMWNENPAALAELLKQFRLKAGAGLPTLSAEGDHSLIFEKIRSDVEKAYWAKHGDSWKKPRDSWSWSIPLAMRRHVVDRLWKQGQKASKDWAAAVDANEPLPLGWRRMENSSTGEVYYLHENGQSDRHRPIPDDSLPEGWVKMVSASIPGGFIYYSASRMQTLAQPPTVDDNLPPGWVKKTSNRDSTKSFYFHRATGTTQNGLPCPGPPEDLPPDWEKVASERPGGQPYYFHRYTQKLQFERPVADPLETPVALRKGPVNKQCSTQIVLKEAAPEVTPRDEARELHMMMEDDTPLPAGWQRRVSRSTNKVYFFNEATGESTFDRPRHAVTFRI